jgi:hypothetical protein
MKMKHSAAGAALGLVVLVGLLSLPAEARVVSYTFTKIADCSGVFANFGGGTSINAQGTVAFLANLDAGGQGIFTGKGGPITTIVDNSQSFGSFGLFGNFGGQPSINNAGIVAFTADFRGGGKGILTGSGGPLTLILIADNSGFSSFEGPVAINARGTVAFAASFRTGGGGIFTSNDGALTTVVDTSTFPGGLGAIPSINAKGTVAFWGQRSASDQGIFTGTGGPLATIADTSGTFASFINPAINNPGKVAFQATLDAGGEGIFVGSRRRLTTVADSTDGFFGFANAAAINARGTVAFLGLLSASAAGIFTGPDPIADKVIAAGDLLFGSEVTTLGLSTQSLNNAGQIAFFASSVDGCGGVYRADPHPRTQRLR